MIILILYVLIFNRIKENNFVFFFLENICFEDGIKFDLGECIKYISCLNNVIYVF